jgi:hypothetical protein
LVSAETSAAPVAGEAGEAGKASCSECARPLAQRPNDLCPSVVHWQARAETVEQAAALLLAALPQCRCGKVATMESYDEASDAFPSCDEHAVSLSDWGGGPRQLRIRTPLLALLETTRRG